MSELSLIVSLSVFKSCTVSCIKETVLGLQQVDVLSHFQNSEQATWADEQLHIKFVRSMGCHCCSCMLINLSISEGATSTLLGNDTGQYAPGRSSDVLPNSSRSSSGGSCCTATFQIQA